mmetsp:Transcript_1910/g.5979  ORF Transcript_1910/g.5979 Transcript_1910/m.5979 type:complete len:202 (+) Transcript_1910:1770-2375(+)
MADTATTAAVAPAADATYSGSSSSPEVIGSTAAVTDAASSGPLETPGSTGVTGGSAGGGGSGGWPSANSFAAAPLLLGVTGMASIRSGAMVMGGASSVVLSEVGDSVLREIASPSPSPTEAASSSLLPMVASVARASLASSASLRALCSSLACRLAWKAMASAETIPVAPSAATAPCWPRETAVERGREGEGAREAFTAAS